MKTSSATRRRPRSLATICTLALAAGSLTLSTPASAADCPPSEIGGLLPPEPDTSVVCGLVGPVAEDPVGTVDDAAGEVPVVPQVSVSGGTIEEGAGGTRALRFTISRTNAEDVAPLPVEITYQTVAGSAVAGEDYGAKSGTLTLEPGQTETVDVPVVGDRVHEGTETFSMVLHDAFPDDGQVFDPLIDQGVATGVVLEDDPEPTVSIAGVSIQEPERGRADARFVVTLSNPSEHDVSLAYATADGTARASSHDYVPTSGTITFPARTAGSKTIRVLVNADTHREFPERFSLRLGRPANARLAGSAGVATIADAAERTVAGSPPPRQSATTDDQGYWVLGPNNQFAGFGTARRVVTSSRVPSPARVVALTSNQSNDGLWLLDQDGGVFTHGSAPFLGSVPALRLSGVQVGAALTIDIASTPDGRGYWVLDDKGGIFTFGRAGYFGSIPARRAAGVPIGSARAVSLSPTPDGQGYWILDEDGGIHSFGNARYYGSIPELRSQGVAVGAAKVTDLTPAPGGRGYWVLDEDGGVHRFGPVPYHGSVPGLRAAGIQIGAARTVGLEAMSNGAGYWVFDDKGGVFAFGSARYLGSIPGGAA